MPEVTILSLADRDAWNAEHRDGGLPSQSWRYAAALSASGVDPKLAIVRSGGSRMLMPFVEHHWSGSTDIATLVGASGASLVGGSAAPLSLWREFAVGQGWVSGYIQLSPCLPLPECRQPQDQLVTSNVVLVLDLRADDFAKSWSPSLRHKIRKADDLGTTLTCDRSVLAEALKRLYPPMLERLGAPARHRFAPATLDAWANDTGSLVLGAGRGHTVEAVSVFLIAGKHAEYHLNACSERGRELAAWLLRHAIVRLPSLGVQLLNLGGGLRPGDGLYRFKARFRGNPTPLLSVRQIYDHRRYDELCRRAGVAATDDWFPAYRLAAPRAD